MGVSRVLYDGLRKFQRILKQVSRGSAAKRNILLKCCKCVLNVYHFLHEMRTFCVPICLHFPLNVDFHTNEAKMIKLRNHVYLVH